MAKVALSCIGKYLKGSGAENILTESCVFGVNVVDSVLSGKNYSRSLKGLQILKEALLRLQWAEFFNTDQNVTTHKKQLDALLQMKAKLGTFDNVASTTMLHTFVESSPKLLRDFDQFIEDGRADSETFMYWDRFIHLMSLVENLVRSDREGNWDLHIQTVLGLLPIFASFDSTNYLRWCSIYLEDMMKLPDTAPTIYQAFKDGQFVVKRSPGKFKAVGADMALEQTINRSQKNTSGIIGSSKKKDFVTMWELVYHEMLGDACHKQPS